MTHALRWAEPGDDGLEPDPARDPQHSETAIIDQLVRAGPALTTAVRIGPGDDAAVLADGTSVTVDALVEGVHWNERLNPADVAFKAVAVSVSDLAAMGARPAWMVLALALPANSDANDPWLTDFAAGLAEALDRWAIALIGGDTTRTPGPRFVSVTMAGPVVGRPITRSGGRPGDQVWITGTPGLAGAGYVLADPPEPALFALRRPSPPLEFALDLAKVALPTAMMDLSDGLSSDLPRLCHRSGVGALVDPARLPVHPALADLHDPLPLQVGAGDDYELLFTAPPDHAARIEQLARTHDVRVTRIGELTADGGARLVGRGWPDTLYRHFEKAGS